jgi:hypothetical protein
MHGGLAPHLQRWQSQVKPKHSCRIAALAPVGVGVVVSKLPLRKPLVKNCQWSHPKTWSVVEFSLVAYTSALCLILQLA